MLIPVTFECPVCGQQIDSGVDPSQGSSQQYVEDCQVCCRPLLLTVHLQDGGAQVSARPESE